jgi:outer membrane protein OmpA-like peptidoglycan-associated protein
MKRGIIWPILLIIPLCIFGQPNDTATVPFVYREGTYLEPILSPSQSALQIHDLSTLFPEWDSSQDWQKFVLTHQDLLVRIQAQIDSLQKAQQSTGQTYEERWTQLEQQITELKSIVIASSTFKQQALTDLTPSISNEFNVPALISIHFAINRCAIDLEALMILNEVIDLLAHDPNSAVLLTGHANELNTPEANIVLSQKRVIEVRNMLISSGISAQRIILRYIGDTSDDGHLPQQKVTLEFIRTP